MSVGGKSVVVMFVGGEGVGSGAALVAAQMISPMAVMIKATTRKTPKAMATFCFGVIVTQNRFLVHKQK